MPVFPWAEQLKDLADEKKYPDPDFHKNILGSYEKIGRALNLKSDFKLLLPICCPISLAFKLGVNIKINFPSGFIPFTIPNPPLLALMLMLMPPPKLIVKFPSLPAIPPPLPILKTASSCGLVARACLANGGASYIGYNKVDTSKQDPTTNLYYDFFLVRYKVGTAISGIISAAKAKNATIPYSKGDLPALNQERRHHHCLQQDHCGQGTRHRPDRGLQSRQADNDDCGERPIELWQRRTAHRSEKKDLCHATTMTNDDLAAGKFGMYIDGNQDIWIAGRNVLYLIDGEKLSTSTVGSNMKQPNNINEAYASDGPGDGFQQVS